MSRAKSIIRIALFPLAVALALAFAQVREGIALSDRDEPVPTPTLDRLAEPTLPANPSQADNGAQQFWFQCLPCHGDRGQGLTDEFRSLYPPEEQNCWESGCHGPRFYENGWTIPQVVPALIGEGSLQKFPNALVLQAYIKASMPYQWPGTLNDETAWALTAFLLRENGLWPAREILGSENAAEVRIVPLVTASPAPTIRPEPSALPDAALSQGEDFDNRYLLFGLLLFLLLGIFVLVRFFSRA